MVWISPSFDEIENGLDDFISQSLDGFESKRLPFKASLRNIRNVFTQPTLRLQLASLCRAREDLNSEQVESQEPVVRSKRVVQRLCRWISLSSTGEQHQASQQTRSPPSGKSLHEVDPGRICLSVQLIRLWIFAHRHLHKMRCQGMMSLASLEGPNRANSGALRTKLRSSSNSLSPQIAGQLEAIAKVTVEKTTQIVAALKEQMESNSSTLECIQSSVALVLSVLAEVTCHIVLWILSLHPSSTVQSLGHQSGGSGAKEGRDPNSSLWRRTPQLILAVCDAVEVMLRLGESKKVAEILDILCSVVTSPLLQSAWLRTIMSQTAPLFWSLALSQTSTHTRQISRFVLCRFTLAAKLNCPTATQTASTPTTGLSVWDELIGKAITEALEVTTFLAEVQTLPDVVYASTRVTHLLHLLADFMRFYGGSNVSEGLGHVLLGSSFVGGTVPLDDILDLCSRMVSLVMFNLKCLLSAQFTFRQYSVKSSTSQCLRQETGGAKGTHISHNHNTHSLIPDDLVISPDQILDYAEKFLVIEPVLEAAAELLSVTLDLVPMARVTLRSNNLTQMMSELFPLFPRSSATLPVKSTRLNQSGDGLLHLLSLVCSFRFHHVINSLVRVLLSKVPTFFISTNNLVAVSTTSNQFLQFMAGSARRAVDGVDFEMVHYRVFCDITALTPSTILDLVHVPPSSSLSSHQSVDALDQAYSDSLSSSVQSHLRILEVLLHRHGLDVPPQLRASIDESVLRLLWLTGHPSVRVTSSPILQYTVAALASLSPYQSLLALLEVSFFGVREVPSACLQAATAMIGTRCFRLPDLTHQSLPLNCGKRETCNVSPTGTCPMTDIFTLHETCNASPTESLLSHQLTRLLRRLKTELSAVPDHQFSPSFENLEILKTYTKAFKSQFQSLEEELPVLEMVSQQNLSSQFLPLRDVRPFSALHQPNPLEGDKSNQNDNSVVVMLHRDGTCNKTKQSRLYEMSSSGDEETEGDAEYDDTYNSDGEVHDNEYVDGHDGYGEDHGYIDGHGYSEDHAYNEDHDGLPPCTDHHHEYDSDDDYDSTEQREEGDFDEDHLNGRISCHSKLSSRRYGKQEMPAGSCVSIASTEKAMDSDVGMISVYDLSSDHRECDDVISIVGTSPASSRRREIIAENNEQPMDDGYDAFEKEELKHDATVLYDAISENLARGRQSVEMSVLEFPITTSMTRTAAAVNASPRSFPFVNDRSLECASSDGQSNGKKRKRMEAEETETGSEQENRTQRSKTRRNVAAKQNAARNTDRGSENGKGGSTALGDCLTRLDESFLKRSPQTETKLLSIVNAMLAENSHANSKDDQEMVDVYRSLQTDCIRDQPPKQLLSNGIADDHSPVVMSPGTSNSAAKSQIVNSETNVETKVSNSMEDVSNVLSSETSGVVTPTNAESALRETCIKRWPTSQEKALNPEEQQFMTPCSGVSVDSPTKQTDNHNDHRGENGHATNVNNPVVTIQDDSADECSLSSPNQQRVFATRKFVHVKSNTAPEVSTSNSKFDTGRTAEYVHVGFGKEINCDDSDDSSDETFSLSLLQSYDEEGESEVLHSPNSDIAIQDGTTEQVGDTTSPSAPSQLLMSPSDGPDDDAFLDAIGLKR